MAPGGPRPVGPLRTSNDHEWCPTFHQLNREAGDIAFLKRKIVVIALEHLIENHMLTCEEESSLLSSLQFSREDSWVPSFYSCLVKKHDKENVIEAKIKDLENETTVDSPTGSPFTGSLRNNTDLLLCKAEYYHQCGEYQKCFELTSQLLEKDPFHLKCTLVHLAAAMELGQSNELYIMACNLVKDYPQKYNNN
ncbi:hypothetical protein Cgig2_022661 [Carnegiea gigantea]|uniref:Uncharacterized protein n=1 Tax=Carnegiea gigantea TaxID=171969 RepID=A0A9Q1JH93_9CARY|nr:hypothetical protein Cgig2_022661 [Carnegiea gigantea]